MESVLEGWLLKSPPEKKLVRARWTKRYFVLKESGRIPGQYVLEYYVTQKQSKKHQKPRRVIDLDQCEQVDANVPCEQHDEYNFMFSIHTLERRFFLMTETEEDMLRWVQSLCRACGLQRDSSTGSDGNASDQDIDHQLVRGLEPSPSTLSQASPSVAAASSRNNSGFSNGVMSPPAANTANPGLRGGPIKLASSSALPSSVATFPLMPTTPFTSLPPSSGEDETSAGSDATTITNLRGATGPVVSTSTAATTTRSRPPPLMLRTTNINSILLSNSMDLLSNNNNAVRHATTNHIRQSSSSLPVAPQPPKPVMPALAHDHDNDIVDTNWSRTHQAYRRTGSDSPYFHLHDFRTGIACISTPVSQRSTSSFDESDAAAMPQGSGEQQSAYDVPPQVTRSTSTDAGPSNKSSAPRMLPVIPDAASVCDSMPTTNMAAGISIPSKIPKPAVPTKPNFIVNQSVRQPPEAAHVASTVLPSSTSGVPATGMGPKEHAPLHQQAAEEMYAAPVEHIYDEKLPSANKMDDLTGQLRKQSLSSASIGQSISSSITTLRSGSVIANTSGFSPVCSSSVVMQQPQSTLHGPITQPRNNINSAVNSNLSPSVTGADRNVFIRSHQQSANNAVIYPVSSTRRYMKTTSSSSSIPQQPTTPPAPTSTTAHLESLYDLPPSAGKGSSEAANTNNSRCGDSAESTATIIACPLLPAVDVAPDAGNASLYDHPKNFDPAAAAGDAGTASHYDTPAALTSSLLVLPQRVKKPCSNDAAEFFEPPSSSEDEEEAVTTTSDNDDDDGNVAESPAAATKTALRGALPPIRAHHHGLHQPRPWAAAGTFSAHASAMDMARSEAKIAQDLQIEPSSINASSSSSSVSSLVSAAENKITNITTNRQHSTSRSSIGRSKRVETRQNHRQQHQQQQPIETGHFPSSTTGGHSLPSISPSMSHSNSSDLEYLHVTSAVLPPPLELHESSNGPEYLSIDPVVTGSSSSFAAASSGHTTPVGKTDQNSFSVPSVPPRSPKNLANAAAPQLQFGSAQHRRSSSSSVTSPPALTSGAEQLQRRRQQQQQLPPGSSFTVGRHLHASTRSNTSNISGISNSTTSTGMTANNSAVIGRDQYHEIDVFRTNALMQTMLMRENAAGNTSTLSTRETSLTRGSLSSSNTLK